jgi:mannan endo-1,4-beta-mannosidase
MPAYRCVPVVLTAAVVLQLLQPPLYSPAAASASNPGRAASAAKAVLSYLASLSSRPDHKIISGQQEELPDLSRFVAPLAAQTGHWPGILGYGVRRSNPAATAERYWNDGGLVMFTDDPANPACGLQGSCPDSKSLVPYTTAQLLERGTALNNQFLADMDRAQVPYLTALRDAGVPVLYRFMIEMNVVPGNQCWSWWNCNLSPGQYVRLFRQAHDYLVDTKGLNNLIWVFSVNALQPGNVLPYYPGGAYADIVGLDEYADDPNDPTYADLASTGKPVAFSEFGPGPGDHPAPHTYNYERMLSAIKKRYPKLVFWNSWCCGYAMVTQNNAAAVLNDPWVVNRDTLPRFR